MTFLLTDVAGSTQLWERAPELMPAVLRRHDDLIRQSTEASGGVLLKAKGEGDSTFSVFARASDGLAAARDAQRALRSEPWPDQTPMMVRMSLHTGEAVERDGDYFGRTVNRAARLRAIAEPGQVLVSHSTAELVADALPSGCGLVGIGVQQLKDLTRPEVVHLLMIDGTVAAAHVIVPFEATTEPASGMELTAIPVPRRIATAATRRFAGRSVERARLIDACTACLDGQARVVMIGGAPGIGKTELAGAAAMQFRADGATILLGRCDEDLSVPYQPWIEALSHLVSHVSQRVLGTLGPRKLADLAGLIPDVTDRHPMLPARTTSDPDTDRYMLFASVAALLAAATADGPMVIVLDDLHWADKPSLQLLRHLLQSSTTMQLLFVVTYRDSESAPSAEFVEFVASLRREDTVQWMTLNGLDEGDIAAMIEHAAGHELDADGLALARIVFRDTDGNPFYAIEVLRHLVESGQLVQHDQRWIPTLSLQMIGLPASVRDVIGRRVARLGSTSQEVLRLASVFGREFDLELLSSVSGRSDLELLNVLDTALAGRVVQEVPDTVGRYAFVHALIQQTLEGELGAARCQLVHRQIAEVLEHLHGAGAGVQIAELARHWIAGGRTADTKKMVMFARAAGDAAVTALAPDEAVRWYAEALRIQRGQPDADSHTTIDLLIALGTTQVQGGEVPLREAALLARASGDSDALIASMLTDTRGWRSRTGLVDAERIALVEAALAAVGPHDSTRRAELLKVYATDLAYTGDPTRSRLLYEDAVSMARRVGHRETLLHVLIRRFTGFWGPDSLEYRLAASKEAATLADEIGDPAAAFWAFTDLWYAAIAAADRPTQVAARERTLAWEERLGMQPGLDWVMTAMRSADAADQLRFEDAKQLARLGADLSDRSGQPYTKPLLAVQLGPLAIQQGDVGVVIDLIDEAHHLLPRLDGNRALSARAHLDVGDRAHVEQMFTTELANGIPGSWDPYWLVVMCWWADVACRLDHRDGAAELAKRLQPWHAQRVVMWGAIDSAVSHYLGMLSTTLGDHPAADRYFAAALTMHTRVEATYAAAWTQLEWARLLLLDGPLNAPARAWEFLRAANTTALQHGFATIAAGSAHLLPD